MEVSTLDNMFRKFNHLKIMVIGDVMIDSYIWGSVDRISPEAPVPVVSIHSQEKRLGGAANVALNIRALGSSPILCSVIGDDERKDEFISLLTEEELTDIGIIVDHTRMTTLKTRVISNRQHLLRVDEEIDHPLLPAVERIFINQVIDLLKTGNIDAVVFQDYDKGIITPGVIKSVVQVANEINLPVLVDPKQKNFCEYREITVFKPNFKEYVEGLHIENNKSDYSAIFKEVKEHLHKKQSVRNVLITLSELGVFVSTPEQYRNIPAEIRDIADVSGAGDTVISVASVCFAAGIDIFDTAAVANLAGGLVCEKLGVVPVDRYELYQECLAVLCEK